MRDEARRGQVVQPRCVGPRPGRASGTAAQPADAPRRVVAVAVGADQQQAFDRLVAQHQVDEAEGSPSRPLEVVDEHHQRPLRRGDGTQHRHAPLRCARAWAVSGSPAAGATASSAANSGTTAVSRPALAPTARQDPRPELGRDHLGLGEQHPAQRAKRLMGRVELEVAPVLVELAGHEPATPARHDRPQLSGQRRLADSGRAADQHAATSAGQRLLERRPGASRPRASRPTGRDGGSRRSGKSRSPMRERSAGRGGAHRLQIVDQPVRGLVAVLRLLLQQVHDDLGDGRGDRRVHRCRRHRHARQVIVDEPQRVAGAERRRAGGELVERRAQRVQVGALIHRPSGPPGLLRRQIGKRPDDLAVVRVLGTHLGQQGRQREVHQAWSPLAGHDDVRRRDIAVHHTPAVHFRDRAGQVQRKREEVIDGHRLRHLDRARAADVDQRDRARRRRRVRQLRDSFAPRSRSSIASSCCTRRCASAPSGSLRITVRPGRNRRVTRVRSLSTRTSVRPGGSRSSAGLSIPSRSAPAPRSSTPSRFYVIKRGLQKQDAPCDPSPPYVVAQLLRHEFGPS